MVWRPTPYLGTYRLDTPSLKAGHEGAVTGWKRWPIRDDRSAMNSYGSVEP